MKPRIVIILTLFTSLFLGVQTAGACMCAFPAPTVADELDRSAVVGVFKLVSIELQTQRSTGDGELPAATRELVKFKAEKVYKGAVRAGDVIALEQIRVTGCRRTFLEPHTGTRFLLYIPTDPASDKAWSISVCSRSAEDWAASADLLYLDKMAKRRGETRLSGSVTRLYLPVPNGHLARSGPLADSPVVIRGNGKTITLKTDRHGVYEIYGLAPGRYEITPVKIEGYEFANNNGLAYAVVDIAPGRQYERDFKFILGGSGK